MKHVFISREGDKEQFVKNFERQKKLSNQELIAKYNNAVDTGIVGVHAQALHLLAMRKVFIERIGKSPIVIEDEFIISLTDKIDSGYFNP
jgi:hypothetical protein